MEQQHGAHSLYLFGAGETHHKDVVPSQRLVEIEVAKALIHKGVSAAYPERVAVKDQANTWGAW